jgi:hypothetical protein
MAAKPDFLDSVEIVRTSAVLRFLSPLARSQRARTTTIDNIYYIKYSILYLTIVDRHIELNADGKTHAFGSHYHPNEHRLELSREDLLALPRDLERFPVYQRYPNFILFRANLEIILGWEKWGP